MKDHYLITGASGFIGSNLVHHLVNQGEEVSIISRDKKINPRLIPVMDKIKIFIGDIEESSLERIIRKIKPTVVFHCAAYGTRPGQTDFKKLLKVNFLGTRNLLRSLMNQKLKLIVCTGSSSEYGWSDRKMKEDDFPNPRDEYGVVKMSTTLLSMQMAVRYNMPIAIFRLFSPFGPYEDGKTRLIPYALKRALRNIDLNMNNPKSVRDFIFIDDVVDAYMKAVHNKKPLTGEIINIGSGKQHTVREVVERILKLTKSKSKVVWNSSNVKRFVEEPKRWEADISKAREMLGWRPKYALEAGIAKTIEWIKRN